MQFKLIALRESILAWEAVIRQIQSGFGPDGRPVTPAVKRHGVEVAQSIIAKNKAKLHELEQLDRRW